MKKMSYFLAVLLTFVTLSHSKPSQAAVGIPVAVITGGSAVAVAGLVVMGSGLAIGAASFSLAQLCRGRKSCEAKFEGGFYIGLFALPLGFLILDGEQSAKFGVLDAKTATQIGVTAEERKVYNEEIDQVNMIFAEVSSSLEGIKEPTSDDSVKAWENVNGLISPEAFSVMQKIVSRE